MRAFVVVGPESSGNKYMVRLLCEAGCAGRSDDYQPYDDLSDLTVQFPEGQPLPENVGFHRSFPHAGSWPLLGKIKEKLSGFGYSTVIIVMVRDVEAIQHSQVRRGHVDSAETARKNIARANALIWGEIAGNDMMYYSILYGRLADRDYVKDLLRTLELNSEASLSDFVDADQKYRVDALSSGFLAR